MQQYSSTSYSSKAQYIAEKPIHQQPTNPPCVYNSTTAVLVRTAVQQKSIKIKSKRQFELTYSRKKKQKKEKKQRRGFD